MFSLAKAGAEKFTLLHFAPGLFRFKLPSYKQTRSLKQKLHGITSILENLSSQPERAWIGFGDLNSDRFIDKHDATNQEYMKK